MKRTGHIVDKASDSIPEKELLRFTPKEWVWPLAFMLSMSMVGLKFPPGFLLVALMLLANFRRNRYDFIITLTFAIGGIGLARPTAYGFNTIYIVLVFGILGYLVLKKNRTLNASMLWWGIYALVLVWLASRSIVSMRVQLQTIVRYLSVIFFIFPLLAFSGREFRMEEFWKRLMPYVVIMCIFYILDALILCGNILVPGTPIWGDRVFSTFWDPIWSPLSFHPFRKYPPGLYLLALAIVPVIQRFRLHTWEWVVILGGMLVSFTFTVISGIIVTYIVFQGRTKQLLKWCAIGMLLFPLAYYVDSKLPTRGTRSTYEVSQSYLRIKSSIDQILSIGSIKDEEDLATLGSMRAAQAIPKIELLFDEHRQWTGFGFLDNIDNTPARYIFYNDLYFEEYSEDNWEVANDIEISALRVFVSIGYIGLAAHVAFFIMLWFTIRKKRYVRYFLSVMVAYIWFGIGDYGGLISATTLILLGLTYGTVLLANRDGYNRITASANEQ